MALPRKNVTLPVLLFLRIFDENKIMEPIKIKRSHVGLLHRKLKIPKDEKIPIADLTVKKGDSPALVKEKTFARNFRRD